MTYNVFGGTLSLNQSINQANRQTNRLKVKHNLAGGDNESIMFYTYCMNARMVGMDNDE